MKRWELSLLLGMLAAVLFTSVGAFGAQCRELRGQMLRLHILAHSDTPADQELKLAVRDAVLAQSAALFGQPQDKQELLAVTAEHLAEMESCAAAVIAQSGYDYAVRAELVQMHFETRRYGDATLPAGRYDAVRLTIGAGAGQNWWCVMFPPMCLPAVVEAPMLPPGDELLLRGQIPRYVPKLAVVELVETWFPS